MGATLVSTNFRILYLRFLKFNRIGFSVRTTKEETILVQRSQLESFFASGSSTLLLHRRTFLEEKYLNIFEV